MAIAIRRFTAADTAAIERLNARLVAGGAVDRVWPEGPADRRTTDAPVRERLFVAADGAEVRGGVWLREHAFRIGGTDMPIGWAKYPVAESLVAPEHSGVPGSLLFQLLREQPRLMALGLGGPEGPFARMLARLGWTGEVVPFLFRIVRPFRVLRDLAHVRKSTPRRVLLDLLAFSGAGAAGVHALHAVRGVRGRAAAAGTQAEVVPEFGPWSDETWTRCRDAYGCLSVRNGAMLRELYPATQPAICRLRVRRHGQDIGWAVTLRFQATGTPDRHFGRLRVGVLVDALSLPADAMAVAAAATAELARGLERVDLVFSNQSHPAWIHALRSLGYLQGPSNFAFYRAPPVENLLVPDVRALGLLVNRGDCDGPAWFIR